MFQMIISSPSTPSSPSPTSTSSPSFSLIVLNEWKQSYWLSCLSILSEDKPPHKPDEDDDEDDEDDDDISLGFQSRLFFLSPEYSDVSYGDISFQPLSSSSSSSSPSSSETSTPSSSSSSSSSSSTFSSSWNDFQLTAMDGLIQFSSTFSPSECLSLCLMKENWWITAIKSHDWKQKRLALLVIGVTCSGMREALSPHLQIIVPLILEILSLPLLSSSSSSSGREEGGDETIRLHYLSLWCLLMLIDEFGVDKFDQKKRNSNDNDNDDDHEDDEEEEETTARGNQPNFQQLFSSVVPGLLGSYLSQHNQLDFFSHYPRIIHTAIKCLLSFFNPDRCSPKVCRPFAGPILDYLASTLLSSSMRMPLFIREVAVSLAGNMSVLSPPSVLKTRSPSLMSFLKTLSFRCMNPSDLFSLLPWDTSTSSSPSSSNGTGGPSLYSLSQQLDSLRSRCFECCALLCRAVGMPHCRSDALEILSQLVSFQQTQLQLQGQGQGQGHTQGPSRDYSDELMSYAAQTCVRLAGVLEDEVVPFLPSLLPPLLQQASQPLELDNTFQDDSPLLGSVIDSTTTTTTTPPTTTNMHQVNSHQIQEREMTLRIIYQYYLDLPQYLWNYTPNTIASFSHLLLFPQLTDDLYTVLIGVLTESLQVYLVYCPESFISSSSSSSSFSETSHTFSTSVSVVLSGLVDALEMNQSQSSHHHHHHHHVSPLDCVSSLVDAIREVLRLAYEGTHRKSSSHLSSTSSSSSASSSSSLFTLQCLSESLIMKLLTVLRDEIVIWVNRKYILRVSHLRTEQLKLEDEIWTALQDSFFWLLRLTGDSLSPLFSHLCLPLLIGLLSSDESLDLSLLSFSSSSPTSSSSSSSSSIILKDVDYLPLMTLSLSVLIDSLDNLPSLSSQIIPVLSQKLFKYLTHSSLIITCVYGLGVLAKSTSVSSITLPVDQVSFALNFLGSLLSFEMSPPTTTSTSITASSSLSSTPTTSSKKKKNNLTKSKSKTQANKTPILKISLPPGVELDDEEESELKTHVLSAMFKILVFQNLIQSTTQSTYHQSAIHFLKQILIQFPLGKKKINENDDDEDDDNNDIQGDLFETRQLHKLFIQLLSQLDSRLIGMNCELFSDCVIALLKLSSSTSLNPFEIDDDDDDKKQKDSSSSSTTSSSSSPLSSSDDRRSTMDFNDYWSVQIIDEETLTQAHLLSRTVVQSLHGIMTTTTTSTTTTTMTPPNGLSGRVPEEILRQTISSLSPELRDIASSFLN